MSKSPKRNGASTSAPVTVQGAFEARVDDLEKRLQSEDRAHRIGQKKTVTYIDIIAEDTVDEKIVKALRDKINIASEVMGEKLKEWI